MKRIVPCLIVAALMMVSAVPARAHHAFTSEFDVDKPVKLRGTLTRMDWTNPHVWLHMNVKGTDGKESEWAFEAGTPNVLFRRGFTKDSLLPGAQVKVEGYQAKDGTNRANGRDLTFPDGRKLFLFERLGLRNGSWQSFRSGLLE